MPPRTPVSPTGSGRLQRWFGPVLVVTLIVMTGAAVVGNWRQSTLLDATSDDSRRADEYQQASQLMTKKLLTIQATLLDPDGEERDEVAAVDTQLRSALAAVTVSDAAHSRDVRRLSRRAADLDLVVDRYYSLLDSDDRDAARRLLETSIEPRAQSIREVLEHEQDEHLAGYADSLAEAKRESLWLRIGTPLIFLVGLGLLAVVGWSSRLHQRAMERLAAQDALTGLPNRMAFHAHTELALAAGAGRRQPTVLMLDLDGFKEVNDTLGHHIGDLLLVQVGNRLSGCVRSQDIVARLGGDEFAVLLVDAGPEIGERTADRIGEALATPIVVEGVTLDIEVSIGIATAEAGQEVSEVMVHADMAMYTAKEHRLGHTRFDPRQAEETSGRLNLLGALRRALDANEIELHYQPKIAIGTGELIGAEALARWQHASGTIGPERFIPVLESTSLIHRFTADVLRMALSQVRAWLDEGHRVPVAVNVSTRSLLDKAFPDTVAQALVAAGVPGELLAIEITESTVMADPEHAIDVLRRVRALGVRTSIDDFGTGYSSMAYLKTLPVDELKVDRSFVYDMATDAGNRVLVESTVELGHNLGLAVVAEGVEDAPTLAVLEQLGCDVAQGYFFARPKPASEFLEYAASRVGEPTV